jgi:two-component system sensor histidine kinase TctE
LLLINKTIERAYDRVLDGSVKAIAERISVEDGEISVDLPQVALGMPKRGPMTASITAFPTRGRS